MGIESPEHCIDISHLSKAKVLAALYNWARLPAGMHHADFPQMTMEEAQKMLDSGQTHFDYVKGRVLKIDLSSDSLDSFKYNKDNGPNAAEAIIETLIIMEKIALNK